MEIKRFVYDWGTEDRSNSLEDINKQLARAIKVEMVLVERKGFPEPLLIIYALFS
jgi:hypothetical protein